MERAAEQRKIRVITHAERLYNDLRGTRGSIEKMTYIICLDCKNFVGKETKAESKDEEDKEVESILVASTELLQALMAFYIKSEEELAAIVNPRDRIKVKAKDKATVLNIVEALKIIDPDFDTTVLVKAKLINKLKYELGVKQEAAAAAEAVAAEKAALETAYLAEKAAQQAAIVAAQKKKAEDKKAVEKVKRDHAKRKDVAKRRSAKKAAKHAAVVSVAAAAPATKDWAIVAPKPSAYTPVAQAAREASIREAAVGRRQDKTEAKAAPYMVTDYVKDAKIIAKTDRRLGGPRG